MKILTQMTAVLSALILAGCGGGGSCDAGTSAFSGTTNSCSSTTTTTTDAASIDVIASALQVPSGGDQVTITATVKNVGNVGLASTALQFSSDSGALTGAATTTDSSGNATAILSVGANRANRNITVTVVSGSAKGSIVLPVTGTTLSYSGVTTVALNGTVQTSVTATDSKGAAIASLPLTVSSSLGNTLSATSVNTDAQGTATISYTAINAGSDNLKFTGVGSSVTTVITISAAQFNFTTPTANTAIPVTTKQPLVVNYKSGGVNQQNKTVAFATTAGTLTAAGAGGACTNVSVSSVNTDANGNATICVSSSTASPATVQATLNASGVSAQATLPISFVAVTPAKLVLQASPTALSPNAVGSTATQKANVLATVTDFNGNPVSGVTVNFNRCVDPSGGTLSQASALTNSGGQASIQYIAGPTSTASNGVLLQATVGGFPSITVPACAAGAFNSTNNTASLTVNQSALFIALGTGNTIIQLDAQTYEQDWVVYVTDSNGVAVPNVNVTFKVLPISYDKGVLKFSTTWGKQPGSFYSCANEDVNYNGVLDPGEDYNGDGVLEPGNVISVTTGSANGASGGTVATSSNGRATISLVYAKSYANWVGVQLQVSAVVSGTESTTQTSFYVAGAAQDYSSQTVSPPGQVSPFGTGTCSSPY